MTPNNPQGPPQGLPPRGMARRPMMPPPGAPQQQTATGIPGDAGGNSNAQLAAGGPPTTPYGGSPAGPTPTTSLGGQRASGNMLPQGGPQPISRGLNPADINPNYGGSQGGPTPQQVNAAQMAQAAGALGGRVDQSPPLPPGVTEQSSGPRLPNGFMAPPGSATPPPNVPTAAAATAPPPPAPNGPQVARPRPNQPMPLNGQPNRPSRRPMGL